MRGHRFKAWDKTHNEWYMDGNVFHLEYSGKYGDFYFDNDHPSNMRDVELIWVESTGLHDLHGKEIWEGDKVGRRSFSTWVVVYQAPSFCAYNECNPEVIFPLWGEDLSEREVIGNIYEAEQDEEEYTCPIHGKCEGGECPRC